MAVFNPDEDKAALSVDGVLSLGIRIYTSSEVRFVRWSGKIPEGFQPNAHNRSVSISLADVREARSSVD